MLTLALLVTTVVAVLGDSPVVRTPLGDVRGQTLVSRSGREYMAFSGIPYAKAPVGQLRFQPPVAQEPWHGVWDGTKEGAHCIQYVNGKVEGEEDCLFLNVFTANTSGSVPVLVYIHGGGFIEGNKDIYLPKYLIDEDMVVVTVNYRLGIYGFLTFETKDLAGNQGLKDQVMALRWVRDNIACFGGDPDRVTITGNSAGGASVYHHIVSPLSRGLFHRALSSSGSSYNSWALSPPGLARSNAQMLMSLIGCSQEPKDAIPCLIQKDAFQVVSHFPQFRTFQATDPMLIFSPTLEEPGPDAFLVSNVSDWQHNPVPLITVLSSAEGLMRTIPMVQNFKDGIKDLSDRFDEVAPVTLHYWASASRPDLLTKKIWDFYFPGKQEITMKDFVNLTEMYGDSWMNYGVMRGANLHKGDVYFWWFDYIFNGTGAETYNIGAPHCGDGSFMWAYPGEQDLPEEYLSISKKYVNMVARFMKTGVPTIPGTEEAWPKWTSQSQNYLQLDKNGFSVKKGLLQERYSFWEGLGSQDRFD